MLRRQFRSALADCPGAPSASAAATPRAVAENRRPDRCSRSTPSARRSPGGRAWCSWSRDRGPVTACPPVRPALPVRPNDRPQASCPWGRGLRRSAAGPAWGAVARRVEPNRRKAMANRPWRAPARRPARPATPMRLAALASPRRPPETPRERAPGRWPARPRRARRAAPTERNRRNCALGIRARCISRGSFSVWRDLFSRLISNLEDVKQVNESSCAHFLSTCRLSAPIRRATALGNRPIEAGLGRARRSMPTDCPGTKRRSMTVGIKGVTAGRACPCPAIGGSAECHPTCQNGPLLGHPRLAIPWKYTRNASTPKVFSIAQSGSTPIGPPRFRPH